MNTINKFNQRMKKKPIYLNQKGIIFSIDATISFVIALITVLIFVLYLSNIILSEERNIEQIELDQKALFIADSMAKNQNSENSLLGACNYDSDKKRVLTNNLNYTQIKTNSKSLELGDFFVKSITITPLTTNQKETIILSEKNSNNCTNVKRFALVDNLKAIIEVKTCKIKEI